MASSSMFDLLTRQLPQFSTRQALLVIGLQNEFYAEDGMLQVIDRSRVLRRITNLVPAFRRHGDIYWIRSENAVPSRTHPQPIRKSVVVSTRQNEAQDSRRDSPVDAQAEPWTLVQRPSLTSDTLAVEAEDGSNIDEQHSATTSPQAYNPLPSPSHLADELFLTSSSTNQIYCAPSTPASAYCPDVLQLQSPNDTHLIKPGYSAFQGTQLLTQLRSRLVTDIYLVGSLSNLCIHSTALDAARHGLQINIVQDCLGYRNEHNHAKAIHRMADDMGAATTTSTTIISRFEEDPRTKPAPGHDVSQDVDLDAKTEYYSWSPTTPGESKQEHCLIPSTRRDTQLPPVVPTAIPDMVSHLAPVELLGAEVEDLSKSHGPEQARDTASPEADLSDLIIDNAVDHAASSISMASEIDPASSLEISGPETLCHSVTSMSDVRSVSQPSVELNTSCSQIWSKKRGSADIEDVDLDLEDLAVKSAAGLSASANTSVWMPNKRSKVTADAKSLSTKGPSDSIGAGDSYVKYDLLPCHQVGSVFEDMLSEVQWQTMSHATGQVPRLVCCQGQVDRNSGSMPVYRHPSDSALPLLHWTPAVARVRAAAERAVGHDLNHTLIQLYRGGQDYISEHSDKTLDIMPDSKIVNVSFGAQRTMRLRSKRASKPASMLDPSTAFPQLRSSCDDSRARDDQTSQRVTERIYLPHNSIFVLGPATNAQFLHGIQPDKRLPHDLCADETSHDGYRISLTFRHIGTFLSHDESQTWGIGATALTEASARPVINADQTKSQLLLDAFGRDNQTITTDREAIYGAGSDVLHIHTTPPTSLFTIFCSGNASQDEPVQSYLRHLGLEAQQIPPSDLRLIRSTLHHHETMVSAIVEATTHSRQVMLRDSGRTKTEIRGVQAVLSYLQRFYGPQTQSRAQAAREMQLLSSPLLATITCQQSGGPPDVDTKVLLRRLEMDLEMRSAGDDFLAGETVGIADFALWGGVRRLLALDGSAQMDVDGHESSEACSTEGFTCLRTWVAKMEALVSNLG